MAKWVNRVGAVLCVIFLILAVVALIALDDYVPLVCLGASAAAAAVGIVVRRVAGPGPSDFPEQANRGSRGSEASQLRDAIGTCDGSRPSRPPSRGGTSSRMLL